MKRPVTYGVLSLMSMSGAIAMANMDYDDDASPLVNWTEEKGPLRGFFAAAATMLVARATGATAATAATATAATAASRGCVAPRRHNGGRFGCLCDRACVVCVRATDVAVSR